MKFDRPTLITITAPTCSGKSYLLDVLHKEHGLQKIVSTTTRDPRQGEVQGVDYNFITYKESQQMEDADKFFELIEFRGTRYGVTHTEMQKKMENGTAPVIILEPKGLEIYHKKCTEMGWELFKVFVHVPEKLRIDRLMKRTISEIEAHIPFNTVPSNRIEAVIRTHTDRTMSICNDERAWINASTWDTVVPGDDSVKAINMIKHGVSYRNFKRGPAKIFTNARIS
jgi:guanylate kinase